MTTTLQAPFPGASHFLSGTIHSLSRKERLILDRMANDPRQPQSFERSIPDSGPSTALSSPQLSSGSSCHGLYSSILASGLSVDSRGLLDEEDDMAFSSYENSGLFAKLVQMPEHSPKQDDHQSQLSNPTVDITAFVRKTAQDDQEITLEPTSYVDYLSHEWKEEDIWLSWSYIVRRRGNIANSVRLEN